VQRIDERYRLRQRSLLAVDDAIGRLLDTLERAGELDSTFLILTSDNGFHLGEHRLPDGKQSPYEESIRMPLIVRGPGVAAGRTINALAANTDLAPTIADLAGVEPPDFVDGRSLAPVLRGEGATGRTAVLVEYLSGQEDPIEVAGGWPTPPGALGNEIQAPTYDALRTADRLYVEYRSGERELYDLRADPFQLENLARSADPAELAALAARLAELRTCAGAACRAAEDAPLAATAAAADRPSAVADAPSPRDGREAADRGRDRRRDRERERDRGRAPDAGGGAGERRPERP